MKSYTDLEQSKKLSNILPLESADMWYWEFPTAPTYNGYGYPMFHKGEDIRNIPCWSLAALLGVLPSFTLDSSNDHYYMLHCMGQITGRHENPIDACYEMIVGLHGLKML